MPVGAFLHIERPGLLYEVQNIVQTVGLSELTRIGILLQTAAAYADMHPVKRFQSVYNIGQRSIAEGHKARCPQRRIVVPGLYDIPPVVLNGLLSRP